MVFIQKLQILLIYLIVIYSSDQLQNSLIYPDFRVTTGSNVGVFNIQYEANVINKARIFVNTTVTNLGQQESLILEEITQSLGLGRDSPRIRNSIFFETSTDGGFATEYADIDKELIRLLYHPDMTVGLNENEVNSALFLILSNERTSN